MMKFQVSYEKRAIKSLKKLDPFQRKMILQWIEKHLVNTEDPFAHGKALKGNLGSYWRYRVGQYRIIAEIKADKIEIIIVNIGHRKDIYER